MPSRDSVCAQLFLFRLAISSETVRQLEEQKRQQTYGQKLLEEKLEQMKNVIFLVVT